MTEFTATLQAEIRPYCLAKPGAVEDHPWGEDVFKVNGKLFATLGESRITVKATLEEQTALTTMPHISPAAYVGRYGWITIQVLDTNSLEHAKELIDRSYELVTAKARKPKP